MMRSGDKKTKRIFQVVGAIVGALAALLVMSIRPVHSASSSFTVMETTIADVHKAFADGTLTSRQLTQMYLDRIEALDKNGPKINSVINVNPQALEEADKLDAAFKQSGLVGPLHGIPIVLKDQMDVAGIPTTLGSVVFKNYVPTKDSFVVGKLKTAGAIILAKVTLGELGGGDTYGSLFGETHNPMIWSAPLEALPAAPEWRSPRTSPPLVSAKRDLLPSAGPRPGTASPV